MLLLVARRQVQHVIANDLDLLFLIITCPTLTNEEAGRLLAVHAKEADSLPPGGTGFERPRSPHLEAKVPDRKPVAPLFGSN
jgi:hypothetical protein